MDLFHGPSQIHCTVTKIILSSLTLFVIVNLLQRGLPYIETSLTVEVVLGNLGRINHDDEGFGEGNSRSWMQPDREVHLTGPDELVLHPVKQSVASGQYVVQPVTIRDEAGGKLHDSVAP